MYLPWRGSHLAIMDAGSKACRPQRASHQKAVANVTETFTDLRVKLRMG